MLVAIGSLIYNGYQFGVHDQTVYTPMVLRIGNHALFPGDYLFDQPSGGYTLWPLAMAAVTRVLPLDWAYFTVHLLTSGAFFLGLYWLSLELFGSRHAAALAVLLLLLPYTVGSTGTFTHDDYLTLRGTAMPFAIGGLICYYRGTLMSGALFCGIALILHPITALPIVCLFSLRCLIDAPPSGWRRSLKALAVLTAFAGVLLLHARVARAATASLATFAEFDHDWLESVRAVNKDAFPTVGNYIMAAFFLTIMIASLRLQRVWRGRRSLDINAGLGLVRKASVGNVGDSDPRSPAFWTGLAMAVCTALLFSASLLVGWHPLPLLVQVRVFRSLYVLVDLGVICLAWLLWEGTRSLSADRSRVLAGLLWLSVGLGLVAWRYESLADIVFKGNIAQYVDFPGRTPVSRRIESIDRITRLLGIQRERNLDSAPDPGRRAWVDVGEWCRDHTRADSVFLIPPQTQGFRIFAERTIVGEYKDGPPGIYSSAYSREWRSRMADLNGYDRFDRATFVELGEKYRAQFVVTSSTQVLGLPVAYRNDGYVVYALPPSHAPGMLGRRGLPDGGLVALGATAPLLRWVLELLPDHEVRAAQACDEDAPQILAEDADRQKLDAAEQRQQTHHRRPAWQCGVIGPRNQDESEIEKREGRDRSAENRGDP